MGVNPTAPGLDPVFGEHLAHRAHELTPRVNLEKLRALQYLPSVDARQSIGDLFSLFCGQRLGLFVTRGHINDRESVAEGFPPNAVVWQKEQIRLVDLVGHRHVKLRPRYASWGRQIDLQMACLLSQSLACCSVTFAADASFSMAASTFQ